MAMGATVRRWLENWTNGNRKDVLDAMECVPGKLRGAVYVACFYRKLSPEDRGIFARMVEAREGKL